MLAISYLSHFEWLHIFPRTFSTCGHGQPDRMNLWALGELTHSLEGGLCWRLLLNNAKGRRKRLLVDGWIIQQQGAEISMNQEKTWKVCVYNEGGWWYTSGLGGLKNPSVLFWMDTSFWVLTSVSRSDWCAAPVLLVWENDAWVAGTPDHHVDWCFHSCGWWLHIYACMFHIHLQMSGWGPCC